MSSQSSVYSEKKIAAYESLFKESNFAKPQEVYLTITVAHVFGQAYILEQEGTKEGDPVYSRFVCPLEEITKVYVNDKIKKPWPLFIQCDTNVKGIIHRKRIVIPCLNDPTAIAEQINEVRAIHMQKFEAAMERENQKKRAELENARIKEQIEKEAKNTLPPLPAVEKLPDPIAEIPVPPKAKPAPAPAPKPKAAPVSDIKSVKALTTELEDSFKALESFDNTKTDIKPLPKKPIFDLDNLEEAFNAKPQYVPASKPKAEAPKKAAPAAEEAPAKPAPKKPVLDLDSIPDAAPVIMQEEKAAEPVPEIAAEPVSIPEPEIIHEAEVIPEPVIPEAVSEPEPAPVPEPAPAPKPAPVPVRINPNGKASELSEFETAVIRLKERRDSGELSPEEYASEKKKLISTLY